MRAPRLLRHVAPLAAIALVALPASPLHAQFVSTSRHQKDKPPYYHGDRPVAGARILWAPLSAPAMRAFGTKRGDAPSAEMQMLLDTLNARLAAMMGDSPRLTSEAMASLAKDGPRVTFGCEEEPGFGSEGVRVGTHYHAADCVDLEKGQDPHNALAITGATKTWRKQAGAVLAADSARYMLLLALRVGEQYPWSGWRGKGLRLGTGYDVEVPWLSAVDKPVTVVQLVGTLLDRDGRPVRSGAEGLFASKPGTLSFLLGGQEAVSDKQLVELLVATRRDDLPGQPPAWEVALRTLVSELTNRDVGSFAER